MFIDTPTSNSRLTPPAVVLWLKEGTVCVPGPVNSADEFAEASTATWACESAVACSSMNATTSERAIRLTLRDLAMKPAPKLDRGRNMGDSGREKYAALASRDRASLAENAVIISFMN
jgi:hypothetical protein